MQDVIAPESCIDHWYPVRLEDEVEISDVEVSLLINRGVFGTEFYTRLDTNPEIEEGNV